MSDNEENKISTPSKTGLPEIDFKEKCVFLF